MNKKMKDALDFYHAILSWTAEEKSTKELQRLITNRNVSSINQTCRKLYGLNLLSRREQENPNGYKATVYYKALFTKIPDYMIDNAGRVKIEKKEPKLMMDKLADKYIEQARQARLERKSARVYVSGAQAYASF